ncbi:MAG: hypothetical protein GEV08_03325 [Acidimicrobiia bacterium]|nr:hypothetical protein [Acidimicrobiia bacterium]
MTSRAWPETREEVAELSSYARMRRLAIFVGIGVLVAAEGVVEMARLRRRVRRGLTSWFDGLGRRAEHERRFAEAAFIARRLRS